MEFSSIGGQYHPLWKNCVWLFFSPHTHTHNIYYIIFYQFIEKLEKIYTTNKCKPEKWMALSFSIFWQSCERISFTKGMYIFIKGKFAPSSISHHYYNIYEHGRRYIIGTFFIYFIKKFEYMMENKKTVIVCVGIFFSSSIGKLLF